VDEDDARLDLLGVVFFLFPGKLCVFIRRNLALGGGESLLFSSSSDFVSSSRISRIGLLPLNPIRIPELPDRLLMLSSSDSVDSLNLLRCSAFLELKLLDDDFFFAKSFFADH